MNELSAGVHPLAPECKYFGEWYNSYNQRRKSPVCFARPKVNGLMNGYAPDVRTQQRYYATQGQFRACNKYTPKDPDNGKTTDSPSR